MASVQASSENGSTPQNGGVTMTAVAIDKDKNSPHAVRWAIDNLINNMQITLIHVRRKAHHDDGHHQMDERELFGVYRGYCARKGVQLKELIIDDNDVAKGILEYISNNYVTNIVVGASTRNALSRKLKNPDVSNILAKSAPDFCNVFVISKGRVSSAKKAQRQFVNNSTPPRTPTSATPPPANSDPDDTIRAPSHPRRRSIGSDVLISERKSNDLRAPKAVDRHRNPSHVDHSDILNHGLRTPTWGRDSIADNSEFGEFPSPLNFGSMDLTADRLDFSIIEKDSPTLSTTINQSSAAELQQLKMEEARKFKEARLAEETALAIAEMEKAKCKAALEAAEKAQMLAEIEVQRRRQAELKAKLESEEKDKALCTYHHNDVRYRKYTLAEIEEATHKFSREHKIGEGGYGPVYKGILNHTRVAIKVLRPDASQGKKQFHQE
ncbi:hypothetical protein CRG98_008861, partial [Punica granatum]